MTSLRNEIESIMIEKNQLESQLMDKVKYMLKEMTTVREIGTILPLEAMVPEGSIVIGRTIGKCRFWHQTGATIIGVKRNGNVHLSPGPDWEIEALDIVIFIGKKDVQKRVHELLRTK